MTFTQLKELLTEHNVPELRKEDILARARREKFTVNTFGSLALIEFTSKPHYVIPAPLNLPINQLTIYTFL